MEDGLRQMLLSDNLEDVKLALTILKVQGFSDLDAFSEIVRERIIKVGIGKTIEYIDLLFDFLKYEDKKFVKWK